MSKISDQKKKKNLINRLKTLKGHIAGIERMLEEDQDCLDILVQISAIKSSIDKVGISLIENNLCNCIYNIEDQESIEDSIKEALAKALKFVK